MAESRRRVVITGVGAVSPIGETIPDIWQALLEGRSGIGTITLFDASKHGTKISAEVKNWDPMKYIDRKEARRMDRFAQFAVAAALLASKDAGIET